MITHFSRANNINFVKKKRTKTFMSSFIFFFQKMSIELSKVIVVDVDENKKCRIHLEDVDVNASRCLCTSVVCTECQFKWMETMFEKEEFEERQGTLTFEQRGSTIKCYECTHPYQYEENTNLLLYLISGKEFGDIGYTQHDNLYINNYWEYLCIFDAIPFSYLLLNLFIASHSFNLFAWLSLILVDILLIAELIYKFYQRVHCFYMWKARSMLSLYWISRFVHEDKGVHEKRTAYTPSFYYNFNRMWYAYSLKHYPEQRQMFQHLADQSTFPPSPLQDAPPTEQMHHYQYDNGQYYAWTGLQHLRERWVKSADSKLPINLLARFTGVRIRFLTPITFFVFLCNNTQHDTYKLLLNWFVLLVLYGVVWKIIYLRIIVDENAYIERCKKRLTDRSQYECIFRITATSPHSHRPSKKHSSVLFEKLLGFDE